MTPTKPRARDLGIRFEGNPGPLNAITDVAGIKVGMTTLIETEPRPGRKKLVRTGVTAVVPHADASDPIPVWAGHHRFNGNGEMTGTHWIVDAGYFQGPVLLTNTHGIGMAHHALTRWMIARYPDHFESAGHEWAMPVVAETYDGVLNDIDALPLTEADVRAALDGAQGGPVPEGSVGGGTGMICYEYKGGTGTASRRVRIDGRDYTVAVLVQANHGRRGGLRVEGLNVGRMLPDAPPPRGEMGSIIAVVATDAPLMPHQLQRVARRGDIGIARGGTVGGNSSGDLFLAFSTANQRPMPTDVQRHMTQELVTDSALDLIYAATVQCVEESVVNAMVASPAMGGTRWDEALIPALPHAELQALLQQHR